ADKPVSLQNGPLHCTREASVSEPHALDRDQQVDLWLKLNQRVPTFSTFKDENDSRNLRPFLEPIRGLGSIVGAGAEAQQRAVWESSVSAGASVFGGIVACHPSLNR